MMFPDDHSETERQGSMEKVEEQEGKIGKQDERQGLMSSVMEGDKETLDDGKVISESINKGVGSFNPDIMFKNLVKDYRLAKKLYGDVIIRALSGYDPDYIEKNLGIPEFQRELEKQLLENAEKLKEKKLVDKNYVITNKAITLSSLVMYTEELDHLIPKGFGEERSKEKSHYGDKEDYKNYTRDRYRDLAMKQSVKVALRRGHETLKRIDLRAFDVRKRGKISVIYGLDSSGSMKGDKIKKGKKAGIALAFKAIQEKNDVGLIVFSSEIKATVEPTQDFMSLLHELTKVRAGMETDLQKVVEQAIELFPNHAQTKHLVLLTDAVPTKGMDPFKDTLEAVSIARNEGITISLIGVDLDEEGTELAKKIVEIGEGKLFLVRDLEKLDTIILDDYYSLA